MGVDVICCDRFESIYQRNELKGSREGGRSEPLDRFVLLIR